jgi:hypothetical protein
LPRLRFAPLATLATLLVLALAPAVGLASGPAEHSSAKANVTHYVNSGPVSVPPNAGLGTYVDCPGGALAVGGGFGIAGASSALPPHFYDDFPRLSPSAGWQANIYSPKSAGKTAKLSIHGVCLSSDSGLLYPKRQLKVPDGAFATLEPRCEANYTAVGGGVEIHGTVIPNRPLTVVSLFPTNKNGWAVEVLNPVDGYPISVEATAICLKVPRKRVVYAVSPLVQMGRFSVEAARAKCPAGRSVLSGGFAIEGAGQMAPYPPRVLDSAPIHGTNGSGWYIRAVNTAPQFLLMKKATIKAFAVCLKH